MANNKVLLLMSKNGRMDYAPVGSEKHRKLMKRKRGGVEYLVCGTARSVNEAEQLQTIVCKSSRTEDAYFYYELGERPFDQTVEGLARAQRRMTAILEAMRDKKMPQHKFWEIVNRGYEHAG